LLEGKSFQLSLSFYTVLLFFLKKAQQKSASLEVRLAKLEAVVLGK